MMLDKFIDWYMNGIIDMWHQDLFYGTLSGNLKLTSEEYVKWVETQSLPTFYVFRILFVSSSKYIKRGLS